MTDGGPYLGSTISLISQSEIRYEGCLFSIDTVKSTVTLSQVRSFGTEGREAPRTVVAGDEVYSLIIFKGSDIKELHVCEPPKPQSNIAQDPAILQHSAAIPSSCSTAPGYHRGPSFNNAQGQYSQYNRMPYNQYGHIGAMPQFFGGQPSHPPGLSGHSTPPPTMTRRSPTMEQGVQASGPISPQKDTKTPTKATAADKHQPKEREEQGLPQRTQQQRRRGSKEEKPSQKKEIHRQQEGKDKRTENKAERPERGERIERGDRGERGERTERGERGDRDNRDNRDRGGRSSQGQRQNWQGYNQNRRGRGRGPRSPGVKEKVGSDFDFTNAQFEKKTLEEEFKEKLKLDGTTTVNGDVVKGTEDSGNETQPSDAPEEEEPYYDSSKSFFDNISSENKGQRQNWKEERKMNCETFGIAYARNRGRGGYYRGGYYRGGYRGNYQGGRGQGRGGRSYRSNRGRGGWRNQGGWNDHANDSNQQHSEITVKTEKTTEATS